MRLLGALLLLLPLASALKLVTKIETLELKIHGYKRELLENPSIGECVRAAMTNAKGDFAFFEYDEARRVCSLFWKIFTATRTPGTNSSFFYSAHDDQSAQDAFHEYCSDECQSGWKKFGNRCFKFDYIENHPLLTATEDDHPRNAQLPYAWNFRAQCARNTAVKTAFPASIRSKEENAFVVDLLKKNDFSEALIGHVDLNGDQEKLFWADGSTATYQNWEVGQPDGGDEYFTVIAENGKWHDYAPKSAPLLCSYEICGISKF